jgi:hypothetical protein
MQIKNTHRPGAPKTPHLPAWGHACLGRRTRTDAPAGVAMGGEIGGGGTMQESVFHNFTLHRPHHDNCYVYLPAMRRQSVHPSHGRESGKHLHMCRVRCYVYGAPTRWKHFPHPGPGGRPCGRSVALGAWEDAEVALKAGQAAFAAAWYQWRSGLCRLPSRPLIRYVFSSCLRTVGGRLGQFWPYISPITRAQFAPGNQPTGCSFDWEALLYRYTTQLPIAYSCGGDTKFFTQCTTASKQAGSRIQRVFARKLGKLNCLHNFMVTRNVLFDQHHVLTQSV